MTASDIHSEVRAYYDDRLRAAGPTPAGVDWNSAASQDLRFRQLLRCWQIEDGTSILDYGCGYGALFDHLARSGAGVAYTGFDISKSMVAEAERLHPPSSQCVFGSILDALPTSDYVVASGIFNVRQATGDDEWRSYMEEEVMRMAELARIGVAFNVLSTYSDPERRRDYLYYADPLTWFDFCKRNVGGSVALLHDYPLYEFTLITSKGG